MIRNIIFDMGGVLIRFEPRVYIERLGITGEDADLLLREVFRSVEWCMMDRGLLKDEEAAARIQARVPAHLGEAVAKLVTMWDRPIIPINGMEELIRELHENGYPVYLLSNAGYRQHDYWPRVPGSQYFTDTLISCDAGVVKPQPEIYHMACSRFGIEGSESVFIDDLPANCEAAEYAGLHSCVFHGDTLLLREKLRALGVKC